MLVQSRPRGDESPSPTTSDTLIVIPARYGSVRLPGKPLVQLGGLPMIGHVLRRLECLKGVALRVATDDERILRVVMALGGRGVMTSADCATGLDRVAEVVQSRRESVIINVQGDEPFVQPDAVASLISYMHQNPSTEMATLAAPLKHLEEWLAPNVVKVVVDSADFALYFSRAPIPWTAKAGVVPEQARAHVGVYAYRRETLLRLTASPPHPLEQLEALEQLRALAQGVRIRVLQVQSRGVGVDTPEDLRRARARLERGERGGKDGLD